MGQSGIYLSVVIPAYNEEARVAGTLQSVTTFLKLQSHEWEVIVVDDGSADQTAQIVKAANATEPRVQLLQYESNHGKGYAVRQGMLHASGKYRLFMDADNSTTIDHLGQFLPLLEAGVDIAIGSRAVPGANIVVHQPRWKELLGKLGNRWIRLWAVPGIFDTQTGFKAFTAEAAQTIFPLLTIDRWGFDVEVLAIARRRDYKIAEIPIRWVNDPHSKVTAWAYFEVLKDVLKVRRNLWKGIY
ncbi:MAG TPA: dolichyl-phosphate beta-glucosyltransferase [Pirellulales bacterium]|jgi:dolichyl-phosphate beta-glucosyltransferase|nr:dolichyl-phosphate beta-glucosyltransferase [Pirellulales bacterium]